MKVQEVMNRDVISIDPDDNIKAALIRLFQLKISGLPVVDERGRLLGMLTEKDFLRYIFPSYIEHVGRFIYEDDPKSIKKKFSELENMKVSQIMCKEVVTVNEDAAVSEVTRVMLTQKVRRVMILNKQSQVVGIIAREDIIKSYLKDTGWKID